MSRTYECMVLLDNSEVREGWDALKNNVTGLMKKHGAEIISAKLWGERALAYPIRQQTRGTYLLVYFDAPMDGIAPMNRDLNINVPVMRHMITVCDEVPETAHAPEAEFDVSKIGVEETPAPTATDEKPAADAKPASDAKPAETAEPDSTETVTAVAPAKESAAPSVDETTDKEGE